METAIEDRSEMLPEFFQSAFRTEVASRIPEADCERFLDIVTSQTEDYTGYGLERTMNQTQLLNLSLIKSFRRSLSPELLLEDKAAVRKGFNIYAATLRQYVFHNRTRSNLRDAVRVSEELLGDSSIENRRSRTIRVSYLNSLVLLYEGEICQSVDSLSRVLSMDTAYDSFRGQIWNGLIYEVVSEDI